MSRTESVALLEESWPGTQPRRSRNAPRANQGLAGGSVPGRALPHTAADTSSDITGFAGDDQFVSDYFRDEFLARTSPARLRFLTRSSILEDLAGQICDDVLQRSGSARVLRELSRSNMPLYPLDHSDGSYRYHPLFKEALAAELHRREPQAESGLHWRASNWYAERERFEEAIDHAIAAGDQTRAVELIWARVGPELAVGNYEAVREWLHRFSERTIADSPQLALCAAYLNLVLGDGELGQHWASIANEGFEDAASDDPSLLADLLILRATLPHDGIVQMGRDATHAAELHPPDSPWRGVSCFYAGVSCQLRGDSLKARELLEEGARRGAANAPVVQVFCLTQLTLLHLDRDDLESASRVIAQAREQTKRYGLDVYPGIAFHLAASTLTRSREGRIEEAVTDCNHAIKLLESLTGFPDWYLAETRIMLARASMNLDDGPAARSLLDEAAVAADRLTDAPALARWLSESVASASSIPAGDNRAEFTPAELRTLQFLPAISRSGRSLSGASCRRIR